MGFWQWDLQSDMTGFALSEQVIGEEVRISMKKQIQYIPESLGELEIVSDFLPSPSELALKEKNVKITIALSKESIDYFKEEAGRHHIKYQRMIRNLLDIYVSRQKSIPKDSNK